MMNFELFVDGEFSECRNDGWRGDSPANPSLTANNQPA